MLSATILLAVWALFINFFNLNRQELNSMYSDLLWSLLFGCSLATTSIIYLLQINLLPSLVTNQWVVALELAGSVSYLAYAFSKKSLARRLIGIKKMNQNKIIIFFLPLIYFYRIQPQMFLLY